MREKILAKAVNDKAFRAALLKDPAAALEKETGVKFPPGLKVKVVEDTADTVHLVLPPSAARGRLGDAELGRVVGGAAPNCTQQCSTDDPKCQLYTMYESQ
jgi:hypothetical protein